MTANRGRVKNVWEGRISRDLPGKLLWQRGRGVKTGAPFDLWRDAVLTLPEFQDSRSPHLGPRILLGWQ